MNHQSIKHNDKTYKVLKWDNILDKPFTIEFEDGRQRSRLGRESIFNCRVCEVELKDTDYVTVCEKCDKKDQKDLDASMIRTKQLEYINELFDECLFDVAVNGTPLYDVKSQFNRVVNSKAGNLQTDLSLFDILFFIKTRVDTSLKKLELKIE